MTRSSDDVAEHFRRRVVAKLIHRAEYFERAKGHRDWTDAARSYRATAAEVEALPIIENPVRVWDDKEKMFVHPQSELEAGK